MQDEVTVAFPRDQFNILCNLFQLLAIAGLTFNGSGNALPTDAQIQSIWATLRTSALSGRVLGSYYVLVQMSGSTKTFWSGSEFVEDLQQAERYQNYGEACQVLWNKVDDKFVRTRIVPMPLSALEPL